jgi:hypothetical protein
MIAGYEKSNDIFGYPQTYKNIQIYPILVKDKKYLDLFYKIFLYPQHTIKIKKLLRLSYLKFYLYSGINDKAENDLNSFLKYATKKENIEIKSRTKKNPPQDLDDITDTVIDIDEDTINETDFDNLREIILKQNGLSIEYVNAYDEDLESRLRSFNNSGNFDFYDEIWTLAELMDKNPEEIANMTIFQMEEMLSRKVILEQYRMIKPLEVSGQIKFKNGGGIENYLYHKKDKGRYDSILIDANQYMDNLQGELNKTAGDIHR